MRIAASAVLIVLAACGPVAPPSSETPTQAPAKAAADSGNDAEEAAERQARIAALSVPYNEASYQAGRRVFAQCRSCHAIEAAAGHRVGPNLHGLFGREIGTAAGFSYSQSLQAADFTWDSDQLDQWLANPRTFLPGNRMAFAGVRDIAQRRDVIAYLMVETAPEE